MGGREGEEAGNSICAGGGTEALNLGPDVAPKYCLTSNKNLGLLCLSSFLLYCGEGEGGSFIVSSHCARQTPANSQG